MNERPVPLTLHVHPAMLKGMSSAAARAGNMTVAAFGEVLLSAAYAARIAQEKGHWNGDKELDAMVRCALACAGLVDKSAVARFLGIDESLVAKALDGWSLIGTQRRPASEPAPAPPKPAPAPAPKRKPAHAKAEPKPEPKAPPRNPLSDDQLFLFVYIAEKAGSDGAEISESAMVKDGGSSAKRLSFDLQRIAQAGLLAIGAKRPDGYGGKIYTYRLTPKGVELAKSMGEDLSPCPRSGK